MGAGHRPQSHGRDRQTARRITDAVVGELGTRTRHGHQAVAVGAHIAARCQTGGGDTLAAHHTSARGAGFHGVGVGLRGCRVSLAYRRAGDHHRPRRDVRRQSGHPGQGVVDRIGATQRNACEVDRFVVARMCIGKAAAHRADTGRDRIARQNARHLRAAGRHHRHGVAVVDLGAGRDAGNREGPGRDGAGGRIHGQRVVVAAVAIIDGIARVNR